MTGTVWVTYWLAYSLGPGGDMALMPDSGAILLAVIIAIPMVAELNRSRRRD